jgi:hypothetical protein
MLMAFCACSLASAYEEPAGLLDRFLDRMKSDLQRLPDYVCTQSIERFRRSASEQAWEKVDTLRFEVALVSGRELYGLPGARRFQDRPLAEMTGRGTIGTGQFALLAQHLFLTSTAQFAYRGETTQNQRPAHEYSYDVAPDKSSYKLRTGGVESNVGFQGSIWIDAETLDLIRLEVQAYDIPEKLGLAQVDTALDYSRLNIGDTQLLLPLAAILNVAAVEGLESMNRTRLSACRHYAAESTIRFEGEAAPAAPSTASAVPSDLLLPQGALVELSLDANLNPAAMGLGDRISASVARTTKDGNRVSIPQGAVVRGRLVRLEKQSMPFPIYEIGLEFDTLETDGRSIPFSASMVEAGPAAGLLQQTKRLDPTFNPRSKSRMDILVREFQHGQGILHWDARHGVIQRGLRMKWRVEAPK